MCLDDDNVDHHHSDTIPSVVSHSQWFYEPVLSTFCILVQLLSVVVCSEWCQLWWCRDTVFFHDLNFFFFAADHSEHNHLFKCVWRHDIVKISKAELWFCFPGICLDLYNHYLLVIFTAQGMHNTITSTL